ncbi:MAG: ribosome small subunit-dependent GTPase A [Gallionella sp.]|nr:ribosome small subunit-dependent GTPase A [Gallionella sp.]
MSELIHGQIIAAFGRQYLVRLADGSEISCLTRGKKSEAACGDFVELQRTADDQAVIEKIAPRRSLLHRSDAFREKLIAANVTQIIVVVAAEPSFNDELLARCLAAAQDQKLEALIVLNKCDLLDGAAAARKRLVPYTAIGYRVLELCAKIPTSPSTLENTEQPASRKLEGRLPPLPEGGRIVEGVDALRPFLADHTSVLVGQSGMGKSTLINALLPDAQAATREISAALDSGKHTTTHARLYRIDETSGLIDCPGVQAFGLHHLGFGGIEQGFVEFAEYLGQCRFHDCHHKHEPGCALRNAVAAGKIDARRLELFQHITANKA